MNIDEYGVISLKVGQACTISVISDTSCTSDVSCYMHADFLSNEDIRLA